MQINSFGGLYIITMVSIGVAALVNIKHRTLGEERILAYSWAMMLIPIALSQLFGKEAVQIISGIIILLIYIYSFIKYISLENLNAINLCILQIAFVFAFQHLELVGFPILLGATVLIWVIYSLTQYLRNRRSRSK